MKGNTMHKAVARVSETLKNIDMNQILVAWHIGEVFTLSEQESAKVMVACSDLVNLHGENVTLAQFRAARDIYDTLALIEGLDKDNTTLMRYAVPLLKSALDRFALAAK